MSDDGRGPDDADELDRAEEERRSQYFVEHSREAIFIQDLDLRYVWMRRPAANWTVEQCLGKDDFELHADPEVARMIVAPKRRVLASGAGESLEIRFVAGGLLMAYEARYEPWRSPTGELIGVAGFVRDISAQRRSEEALREAKLAADAANAAKSVFLANMSHELRTPMNAILGMTDLALREATSTTLRDYLHTVRDAGEALLELVDQLLDFSRIEAGQMRVDRVPFELGRLVLQVARTLGVRAREKGLQLTCEVDEALPAAVVGDPLRLRQVLINLVGNAIKFTEVGGVTLSARALADAGDDVEGALRVDFAVTDTGIGIAPADQRQIFASFTQADPSISRKYGGSGLGLAIVRSLVEMMGGEVRLESAPGRGSTFSFTLRLERHRGELPLAAALAADTLRGRGQGEERPPVRALRFLLAEDTPANQKLVTYILRGRGHAVVVAVDGREAIDRVREGGFDVILMDIQMPEVDGFEATRAIRALNDPARAQVPIVAITAHALRGDAERCLAAGMDAYIAKPLDRQHLIAVVEGLAERFRGAYEPEPELEEEEEEEEGEEEVAFFDPDEALRMCFGDPEMLRAMAGCLVDEAGPLCAEIQAALARGDGEAMARAAHRLKNTVLYLGCAPAVAACERVSERGRASAFAGAEAEVLALGAQLRRLQAELAALEVDAG